MTEYLIRRVLLIVPVLLLISVLAFIVMEAPPGDFVTSYMMRQAEQGALFDGAGVEEGLRAMWGLDKPWYVRYLRWLGNLLRGNLGYSLSWQAPVQEIIASRFVLSMTVALAGDRAGVGDRLSDRYLLGDPAILAVRQRRHLRRLPRAVDSPLPAGADHDVSRQPLPEHFDRRAVLAEVRHRRLELGQADRLPRAPVGSHRRDRGGGHRPA